MFEKLICEVKELNERILAECKKNNEINNLYRGYQIFFSPVKEKQEIILIGINPGSGYYKYWEENVQEFNPPSTHQYFIDEYGNESNFDLAKNVKDIFKKANKIDKLEHSLKTNLYFWATDNEGSLWKLLSKLPDTLRNDIYCKSKVWIQEIVEKISPKVIICEGTGSVYNHFKNVFGEKYIEKVGHGRIKIGKINDINIIAFKRFYSTITDETKKELIPLLEKYI